MRSKISALFRGIFILLVASCLAGCATSSQSPVRSITTESPGIDHLVREAREVADRDYAKIAELLQSNPETAPRRFAIRFKKQVWSPFRGPTLGFAGHREFSAKVKRHERTYTLLRIPLSRKYIELGTELLLQMPGRMPHTLRHEMTHLHQNYASGAPAHWREGIADYVALSLGASPNCTECTVIQPHYEDGYQCAAALLQYLTEKYDPHIVPKLHLALTRGNYSDEFFIHATGQPLDALWQEFQATTRFTDEARTGLKLREQFRESTNNRPALIPSFFEDFLRSRPSGPLMVEACQHLESLRESGKIPGPIDRPTSVSLSHLEIELPPNLPTTRTVDLFYNRNQKIVYRYRLQKTSATSGWDLLSVLKVDNSNGKTLQTLEPGT